MLKIDSLYAGYGGVNVLNGVSLSLPNKKIGVIIGPNGAGKTTILKAIFALLPVRSGNIWLGDQDITNSPPQRRVEQGVAYVPQENNIFVNLSVEENLQMGAYCRRDNIRPDVELMIDLFPPLGTKLRQPAGELSGGQRQMVAIGRALMSRPQLLLLDEPTASLSPRYTDDIFERIVTINRAGVDILMVEQNAKQALAIADLGYVLANGENRFTDSGRALRDNPEIAKSFLGG